MGREALTERQQVKLRVAKLRVLRLSLGVPRMDRIENEYVRGTAQVRRFEDLLKETNIRWHGHILRCSAGEVEYRMLKMELPGKWKIRNSKRRLLDVVKESRLSWLGQV